MKVPLAIILINKSALVPVESPPTRGEVLRVSNNLCNKNAPPRSFH